MKIRIKSKEQYEACATVLGMVSDYSIGDHWEWAALDLTDAICNWEERQFNLVEEEEKE